MPGPRRMALNIRRSSKTSDTGPPRVPSGTRVYAIGDIHGRSDLLDIVLTEIMADAAAARERGLQPVVVFLGDYVDRGPDSAGVVDRLCRLPAGDIQWHFLEGNHESAMQAFLGKPEANGTWFDYGGVETLASYGVEIPPGRRGRITRSGIAVALATALPTAHQQFLDHLDLFVELGDYIFVHAGLRPGIAVEAQSRQDLLWIREPFLSAPAPRGKRVVHGHSITDEPEILPARIGIDTGAYASGRLTCLVLEEANVSVFATKVDRSGVHWVKG